MAKNNHQLGRREMIKYGSTALIGGVFAGCSGQQGSGGSSGSGSGSGGGEQQTQTSKFGIVGPFSGPGSAIVTQSAGGYKLAIKDGNSEYDKFTYEMFKHDASITKPNETVSGIQELNQKEKINIFQTYFSPLTLAAFPVIKKKNSLLLTSATSQPLIDADYKNLLINNVWAEDAAVAVSTYVENKLKWDSVAFITTKDQYGESLVKFHKEHFNRHGISEFKPEYFKPGTSDFTNMVSRLKSADVDGIVLGTYQPYAGSIISQASQIGWNIPRGEGGPKGIGIFGENDPSLLDQVSADTIDGWTVVDGPSPTSTEQTKKVNKRYKESHDGTSSTYLTILSYFTGIAVIDAIATTGADPTKEAGKIRAEIGKRGLDNLYEILGIKFYWDSNGRMRVPFSIVKYDQAQPETIDRMSIKDVQAQLK